MRPGAQVPPFSVDARADRWLRRWTGPWMTSTRGAGGVQVSMRYRYRPRVEVVRSSVAQRDLSRQLWLAFLPILLPILRAMVRVIEVVESRRRP